MDKKRKPLTDLFTYHDYLKYFRNELSGIYPAEESDSIFRILCEDMLKIPKTDIYLTREPVDKKQSKILLDALGRLVEHVPVQHITGFTWFMGRKILVNPAVLIPRPETEEMVMKFVEINRLTEPRILDIGTGSGCIAIALKMNIPGAKVYAIDNSEAAIRTARKNARLNQAEVSFIKGDIFDYKRWKFTKKSFDYIISNPPYIRDSERRQMRKNVILHEPVEALFVPDEDPLKFYGAIAEAVKDLLKPGGKVFLEINENLGKQTAGLFRDKGYRNLEILKDLFDKERFLIG